MQADVFEFNDVGIRVARGGKELVSSPGYAAFVNNKIEVGERGHAHAWLTPRHASNRFWHDLNTAPLHQFGKRIRHAGDLAYLHLEQLRERTGNPKSAIFVTPSAYQRSQLSLLLGIAQASGMTVHALVDSAAAVGAGLSPGQYTYLEAALHHCTLTQIEVDGGRASRRHTEVIAGCGMVQFEQKITECLVEGFLARCRFDPLHDAHTEQLLHTHLAEWMRLIEDRPEITLSIDFHGTRHQTQIHREVLAAAITPLVEQIKRRTGHDSLLLDHRYAALAGVTAHWPHAQIVPADAVFKACMNNPDLQTPTADTGLSLRTTLATLPSGAPVTVAPTPVVTASASHLLINHIAYPITGATLYLTPRGQVHRAAEADAVCRVLRDPAPRIEPLHGAHIAVNGKTITASAPLTAGDHVTIPGFNGFIKPITVHPTDAF
jgi:hypothetical protein